MNGGSPKSFVDVVFPFPPPMPLTYAVPERFREGLRPGHRVLVPLGRRRAVGFAVSLSDRCGLADVKPVEDVLDDEPVFSEDMLALTRWVADYYFASWGETLRAALPPGLAGASQLRVERASGSDPGVLTEAERRVWDGLPEGRKTGIRELEKKSGVKGIRYTLNRLAGRGLVRLEYVFDSRGATVKTEKWVTLRREPSETEWAAMKKRTPRQAAVLERLRGSGGEVRRSDLDADAPVLGRMEKAGWIEVWEEEVFRDSEAEAGEPPAAPVRLTPHQAEAAAAIRADLDSGAFHAMLLHGVTGSGKTQVYVEAVRHCLEQGRDALVLIPEIALTPLAVRRFRGAFGDAVTVLHSRQSRGERFDAWRRIRDGGARVALGPRSAVFAPLRNLGLIVVDEEHESSYKQNDPSPRYHGRDTAIVRGRMAGATVVLGSATPSLESYANAASGKYELRELPERVDRIPMPSVSLADLKEAGPKNESLLFTPVLLEAVRRRIAAGEQVILLKNRRGYSSYIRCSACGEIDSCPHCEISLTFHRSERRLKCHYCGYQKPAPDVCARCGSASLQYRGTGTQRIEEEIRRLFPDIRLIRMDMDTMRRKGAHTRAVLDFESRKGDILLGTQIVAKGHDFPGVTLVGVISADTGLHFPDFRSAEWTFQLLTQAAGRPGRRDRTGEVVIQTLSPDHPVIGFATRHDFKSFYAWEMQQREELGYPPFGRIVLAVFRGPDSEKTERAALRFLQRVPGNAGFEILGPAAAPIAKLKGEFRYQIIFRQSKAGDPSAASLRAALWKAMNEYMKTPVERSVRLYLDMDPMDLM
jgi:primosomal protein N' (replication factor Y) (superfamily II helicase)